MATINKVTIIVPCYNELPTIGKIYDLLMSLDLGVDKEIIFIDDKSTDGSRDLLKKRSLEESSKEVKYIFNDRNSGKGTCIRKALEHATGDYTIIQDADLEYNPNDIIRLVQFVKNKGAYAVYGSRNSTIKNKYSYTIFYIGVQLLTKMGNLLYKLNLTDIETCYKLINTKLLKFIDLQDPGFGVEIEITAKISKLGVPIYEIPIHYTPRSFKGGKKIKAIDGIRALWLLVKFKCNDLHFGPLDIIIRTVREGAVHKNVGFFKDDSILDVGCGKQASLAWQLHKNINSFTGLDLDVTDMDFQNISLTKGNVNDLRRVFGEKKFSKIIGLAIIEHVDDADKFIADCRYLLARGGQFILTTPLPAAHLILTILSNLGLINQNEIHNHKQYFSLSQLKQNLQEHNFKIKLIKTFCGGFNCLYIAEK